MKIKKTLTSILAIIIALSMSAMTVWAEDEVVPDTSATVDGDGDTKYIDTEIISVILPTSTTWDFTLDPQGLAGIDAGDSGTLDSLSDKGKIIASTTVFPKVINKSSVDITVTVKAKVTGDANVVLDDADVAPTDDTKNNILLNIMPSTAKIDEDAATFAGTKEYAVGSTPSTLLFKLDKAVYEVKNTGGVYTYEIAAAEKGNGTNFTLSGKVNPNANWSAFADGGTKKVGISAVFSFTKYVDTDGAVDDTALTYGFISYTAGGAGSVSSYKLMNGSTPYTTFPATTTAVTLTVDGLASNVVITKIVAGGYLFTKTTHYTTTGNKITFVAGKAWPPVTTSNDMVITYTEDGVSKTATITGLTYTK